MTCDYTVDRTPGGGYIVTFAGSKVQARSGPEAKAEILAKAEEFRAKQAEKPLPDDIRQAVLTNEDIAELAAKYSSSAMSRTQYDSFLDELVDKGVLKEDELKYLGYHGLIYGPPVTEAFFGAGECVSYESDEYGVPVGDGISPAWSKAMSMLPKSLATGGLFAYMQKGRDVFTVVADILEAMQTRREV